MPVDSVSNVSFRPAKSADTPDRAVARWVSRTLAADPPRAKSLIVTVWGDALAPHGGAVWLRGLIALMAPFGMNERLVRTSVFRLARDGWLVASTHGRVSRYRLTAGGARRFDEAYRRIYARPDQDWKGDWELVAAIAAAARRPGLRNELHWSGFGEPAPWTFVRPAPTAAEPAMPLPAVLGELAQRGQLFAAQARDLPGARPLADMVGEAWDLATVAAGYRRFLLRFGAVIERFRPDATFDPGQCFVVRTLLIHAYRRVLLRDPLLPPALLPLDWPGAAAYALCRDFYRLTHRAAERHLAATFGAAGEELPAADPAFYARFDGLS